MGKAARRPEHQAPPEIFYDEKEAEKYTRNSRIMDVQTRCTVRALDLLQLPDDEPAMLLDLGCGSGLSGEAITERGHYWVGMDISEAMLDVAVEREVEGDLMLTDLGHGMPFRPAMFDGAISISALQWLCNADKTEHNPARRLYKLFTTLFACLARGSRAVFQFYPENEHQMELIVTQSIRAGFAQDILVDFPNSTRAKKVYLVLRCGGTVGLPRALKDETSDSANIGRLDITRGKGYSRHGARLAKIAAKKLRRQKQGKQVHRDSKYTGRPRSSRF